MKKHIIASLILLAAVSCVRERHPEESAGDTNAILATIVSNDTKAILLDNPGVRMESFWVAGEQIGVGGSDGPAVSLSVAASDISSDGKSAIFRSESSVPSGKLIAYSPFQSGVSISGGSLQMTLPATQHYIVGNGVSQPDPAANLLAGSGNAKGGLSFRNTLAILKIGQSFESQTVIRKVEFRDLSGEAVAGEVSITPDSNPVATVTGAEKVITLDCGEEGVRLEKGEPGRFYIIIPARSYPKGIEITFVTEDGGRISRTSGARGGVSFERSVIYPVGDVPNREYILPNVARLQDNAIPMTPELLRQVTILSCNKVPVICDDGSVAKFGETILELPAMDLFVPMEMDFKEGDFLLFDSTDDFPSGGVLKVSEIQAPFGDDAHKLVKAVPTSNPFAAYKSLEIGGDKMYDDEGNYIEGSGLDIDLSGYLSEIRDASGAPVPFSRAADGSIVFGEDETEQILSKAIFSHSTTLSSPPLKLGYEGNNCSAELKAKMSVSMRAGLKVEDGELVFINFNFNPVLNLSADFKIKAEGSIDKSMHLITMDFVPGIPVCPGVILTPELEIQAGVGVGGSIELSTNISYDMDLGRFGFSYLRDNGFTFRHQEAPPKEDEIQPQLGASLSGTLYASASLIIIPRISLYGLFSAGLSIEPKLKFGLEGKVSNESAFNARLFLQPTLTFTPETASLGGIFSKKWDGLIPEIEFDPIWERYLAPVIEDAEGALCGPTHTFQRWRYASGGRYYLIHAKSGIPNFWYGAPIFMDIDAYKFQLKSTKPTLDPWDVVVQVTHGQADATGWEYIAFAGCERYGQEGFSWVGTPGVSYHSTGMVIQKGSSDENIFIGDVMKPFSNDYCAVGLNFFNKRTGKYLYNASAITTGAYKLSWGNLPCGDPYIHEEISKDEYDNMPGVPISDHAILEANGYQDWEPTLGKE